MPLSTRRRLWQRYPLWKRRLLLKQLRERLARKRAREAQSPTSVGEHPSLAFWRGMGVWITRIDHFPAEFLPEYAKGYRFVVVPALSGVDFDFNGMRSVAELKVWIAKAKELGYRVVGSQWGEADYVMDEVTQAVWAIDNFGFDGWVVNGEKPYEGGGKSGRYVTRFRQKLPDLPLGWSPEPRLDLDHLVLQQAGVCYMPQAYPLESGWNVDACVQVGLGFGYQPANIVPLIQAYPKDGRRWPAGDYAERARHEHVPGLILYTGNQAMDVPQYWRDLIV